MDGTNKVIDPDKTFDIGSLDTYDSDGDRIIDLANGGAYYFTAGTTMSNNNNVEPYVFAINGAKQNVLYFGSELSKKVFLSTHPAISECKLDVVRPGTPVPQKIEPVDLRKELGIADNEVLAMYHGRLAAEKGLDVLVESIDRIRDEKFRLVLIGRGSNDYVTHLRQLIESRGLQQKILLAGFRQPVLPCVAAADLGILVSIVPEGCGLSLQEYMSQGRPVITTNNGGQSDFVFDNRNGLLVPPGDAQALAATLSRLINDSALRQKLGEQATADFRDHLNYERFYEQIKCLYGINR